MGKLSIIIRSGTRENDREEPAKQEQQQQRQQRYHRQSSCRNNAKVISRCADSSAVNSSLFDVCEETATVRSGTRGQPPRALNALKTFRDETTSYSLFSFCTTVDSDNSVANKERKERDELLVVGENFRKISSSSSLSSSSSSSLLRKPTKGLSTSIILALLVMSVLYEPILGVPAPASSSSSSYELQQQQQQQQQQQVETYSRFLEFEENYEEEVIYEPTATATPTSAGHSSRNVLGDEELEIIRRSIVESLGLRRIPDPSKANVSQTEYERAHREYLKKVQLSQHHGPPQESRKRRRLHVFHGTEHSGNRTRRETTEAEVEDEEDSEILQRLFFPVEIPEDLDEEDSTLDHASLRFLLVGDHRATDNDNDLEIIVYLRNEQLYSDTIALSSSSSSSSSSASSSASSKTRPTTRRKSPQVRRRIRLDDPRDPKWLEVDVTELAIACLLDERKNLELNLQFLQNGSPIRRVFALPALNVFTSASYDVTGNNNGNRRRKRGTPEKLMSLHKGRRTECREDNKKCCRHEMTVIFKDLKGFEFIVQPKTFDAGYCKGRCPPRYNPAHHHALLQSLIWKEDKRKAPRPCCAPSKLTELEILYFDENDSTTLKISNWKNMRVLECACS